MTVQEMHDWFDLVQDKVDTVYFIDTEKDQFINRAIQMYVNDLSLQILPTPDVESSARTLVEMSEPISKRLSPLINQITVTPANASKVLYSEMSAQVNTKAILGVLRVSVNSDGSPVNYVRHGDVNRRQQNTFKKASTSKLSYFYGADGIYFTVPPAGAPVAIDLSVIVEPVYVDFATSISTNMPIETHDEILARALALAGLGSMDTNLMQIKSIV